MKKTTLLLSFIFLSVIGFAQTRERTVTAIEVEPSIGLYRGYTTLSLEARYNFKAPWDIGLRESIDYCFTDGGNAFATYDIVGDYNLKRGENLSLFVGAGIGFTSYDYYNQQISAYKRRTMFHFMPRVGAEIMNRIRLSAYLNTYGSKDETCGVGVSAGFVLGGSRMENKEWNTYHFEFEPFFGNRTNVDFAGHTVAWYFKAPLELVAANTKKVLAEENTNMRIFGKGQLRGHRRLGVLLARDESVEKALAKVERMAKSLKTEL